MEQRYEVTQNLLKQVLQNIPFIALTSDILTVTNSTRSFLVVTAQFLNEKDEVLESFCLSAQRMLQVGIKKYDYSI